MLKSLKICLVCLMFLIQPGEASPRVANAQAEKPIFEAAFSSDGQYVSAAMPGKVVTWRVSTKVVQNITQTSDFISGIDTSGNTPRLGMITFNGVVHKLQYYSLKTGKRVHSITFASGLYPFYGGILIQNNRYLESGPNGTIVYLANLKTHRRYLLKLPYPVDIDMHEFNVSGSGNLVAYLAARYIWFSRMKLNGYSTFVRMFRAEPGVWPHVMSSDAIGDKIAVIGQNGELLQLWTKAGPTCKIIGDNLRIRRTGLAMAPDGASLAVADFDGRVHIYSTSTRLSLGVKDFSGRTTSTANRASGYPPLPLLDIESLAIRSLQYSPDSQSLFVGTRTGHAYLWNVSTGLVSSLPVER